MPAPNITFAVTRTKISDETGMNSAVVTFMSDIPIIEYEVRATRQGEEYGVGIGINIQSSTQKISANTSVSATIYDTNLVTEGTYRISIFARSEDGGWNDNYAFLTSENEPVITSDGLEFLVMSSDLIISPMFYTSDGNLLYTSDGRLFLLEG